jgi:hypothetical protein
MKVERAWVNLLQASIVRCLLACHSRALQFILYSTLSYLGPVPPILPTSARSCGAARGVNARIAWAGMTLRIRKCKSRGAEDPCSSCNNFLSAFDSGGCPANLEQTRTGNPDLGKCRPLGSSLTFDNMRLVVGSLLGIRL